MAGMNSWSGGRRRFGGGALKLCRLVVGGGGRRRKWDISSENEGEEDVDLSELFNCVSLRGTTSPVDLLLAK